MAKDSHPANEFAAGVRRSVRLARRNRRHDEEKELRAYPIRDVWQWKGRKYRIRSIVLLLFNAILFAGLGVFAFWLRTGIYTPLFERGYWDHWMGMFDWTREHQNTLIDFLIYPIPVSQVPMMMIISALVMASLTAIPILVSLLYRFRFSLIFIFIVGFVAVLPWLAIMLTLCCALARWWRLQYSFRYATAVVAMLPLLLYYTFATRNTLLSSHLPPMELAKLYVPWVMAFVASCAVMAIVLTIARIVNYRPGAIAPLMAILFATPVILFEAEVGRDELYYRMLEYRFGPTSKVHFVDNVDATPAIRQIALTRLEEIKDPRATLDSVMEQVRLALVFQLAPMQVRAEYARLVEQVALEHSAAFAEEQAEAQRMAERFRIRFPHSRYLPNALYIEGRAIDLRVDREFFLKNLMIRHYQDFPNMASRPIWRELYLRFPDSPLASVAGLRLAILTTRAPEGSVDEAINLLDHVIERWSEGTGGTKPPEDVGGLRGFFAKRPASDRLDVDPISIAQQARELRHLLVNNRDPEQNDRALKELFSFNPMSPYFTRNLRNLLAAIQRGDLRSQLDDNIELRIALAEPSRSLRIAAIEKCVEKLARRENSDALPRALYELGNAYQFDNRLDDARLVYRKLLEQFPKTPWAQEAERRIAVLGMAR
ncbi:MAG: hypothetical protein GXY44_03630 [Phycisphaerales bacterium]|nr:hypothetical protein [Phycisphaerales bacterium]